MHAYDIPRSGIHIEVLSRLRLSARYLLQLCGSKYSLSSLASITECFTPVLDVAWRSDRREISGTPRNDGFRCSLEPKGLQIRAQRPNIA